MRQSSFYSVGMNKFLGGILKEDLDKETTRLRLLGRKIEEEDEKKVD